ncbi:peptidoglycan DD-metalloendopeptidase family protein [Erythrobacter sp. T5W1-R]|nr:peptidoglycan DD-metalloendopeptidase family protein [Erythrobacter sp. T5W1-R]MEA1618726.1 peptidoglycan DD-metalloendopeptidase family protein [Erythrobacter sp. T5W1-R]
MSDPTTARSWQARLNAWFPDREFFMRSHGEVRFIRLSSRLQKRVAGGAVAAVVVWLCALAVMGWNTWRAEADLASFADEKARVATASERLEAYSGDIDRVVADLEAQQKFLEQMTQMLPEDTVADAPDSSVTDSRAETTETIRKVSAVFPEARGLAELEARQIALAEKLTRFANARARRAEAAIRKLNLDPRFLTRETREAMGGPFEALTDLRATDALDPRFEKLGFSLARMAVLERALEGIPQVVPATIASITSGFGYRRDPFNGRGAMHAGLDFKGAIGSPIYAAAMGTVSFVGWKSGYGKTVEITHGNGLMTRYAHLSRFDVKPGQAVAAGDRIAGMGSTGRSTGPHLHFEVRINDRAINPRPFLEAAPDVLKEARGSDRTGPLNPARSR